MTSDLPTVNNLGSDWTGALSSRVVQISVQLAASSIMVTDGPKSYRLRVLGG